MESLVEQLLAHTLPVEESNGIHPLADDNGLSSLEEVVALIKATLPNPAAIQRGDKAGDMAYIQALLDTPPTDTLTREEWEQYWPAFEQELTRSNHHTKRRTDL